MRSKFQPVHRVLFTFLLFLLLLVALRSESQQIFFDSDAYFYELPSELPKPHVSISVDTSQAGIVVFNLETDNFRMADVCSTPGDKEITGHAHIYLNNKKVKTVSDNIGLLYVPPGEYTITVSLHVLPNHQALLVDGHTVSSSVQFTVPLV